MDLPRLRNPPLGKLCHCGQKDYECVCEGCSLEGECVGHCDGKRRDCEQRSCFQQCNDCGGSAEIDRTDPDIEVTNVPAICAKSPMRDLYLSQVKKDRYKFKKRSRLEFNAKAITITTGSSGDHTYDVHPPETEVVAVNLRHVWSGNGWYSRDLKDYLKLPKGCKLMLLTAMQDHYLEIAWNKEVYYEDFESVGIDFWQALDFSAYPHMSHFNNLWIDYRTMWVIEQSKAHFSGMPCQAWDLTDRGNFGTYVNMSKRVPNIIQNVQGLNLQTKHGQQVFKKFFARLKRWDELVPVKLNYFFIGAVSRTLIANIARTLPTHDLYFLSFAPWITAHKGAEFTLKGQRAASKLPKPELLLRNQRHYAKLVADTVAVARRETSH